ncbi:MFS transporter [Kribbella orskensis]|uniref:MFS transporter n=1 Tax=Kribbella orskensis TaxID=2512216 RepID=A0ABY2BTP3_9ACTN|nr:MULTISPECIES: MFS transporter [Kribbella]TCN44814.1 MFS transporter [Kribbella sp. VKM Ac-2500]TCO31408.1 MFS transporter [Kribbella orskensis]
MSSRAKSLSRFAVERDDRRYKWVALSNTTLGTLMATINSSIVIISLPDIFRGIKLDPLRPGNVSYLLWTLMGFLVVTAVLVVTLGRLGDIYGRVKIYNLGFAVFTVGSLALVLDPLTQGGGALWLILWRVVQGVGAAMLFANSTAILTDAFPAERRGFALGINQVAAIGGSFIGLIVGGLLAPVDWRLVFFVSVPFGLLGTVWSYRSLRETSARSAVAQIDWWGNALFAVGLTALLAAITYGIQPYGGRDMGWTNPWVLAGLVGGVALLVAFCLVEASVDDPMFDLSLFRIRAFSAGNLAGLLASVGRGGLQFMLIIWLQGIWLPLHGFSFSSTPLWAGIYLLPLTVAFLFAGPLSGYYSDRFGARTFATGGLLLVAVSFLGLLLLPTDFNYWAFAGLLVLNGIGSGLFSAPNTSAIMSSVPAIRRGAASGMRGTFFNSGTSLSIGVFFTLMIVGLAQTLPGALTNGLEAHGVSPAVASGIAHQPPVGSLFAAFLGYNPLGTALGALPASATKGADLGTLTSKEFFPQLISAPFHHGLVIVLMLAILMSLVGAAASLFRGPRYIHAEPVARVDVPGPR